MPTFSSLNIFSIMPILVIVAGAIVALLLDLLAKKFVKNIYIALSLAALCISFAFLLYAELGDGFFDLISIDSLSILSQFIILITSIAFLLLTLSKAKFAEFEYAEYFVLFLLMIAGYQFMVSSNNLIVIFLALETSSLALYALIAMSKEAKPLEAAIKYFTLGALGSGFFAFGIVFIYLATGTLDLLIISENLYKSLEILEASEAPNYGYLMLLGFVFLLASIGFKLSFFPFHTWVPDVYEGSSYPLAFFMSIATKIAAFVVAIRIFATFLDIGIPYVEYVLFIIIVLTTTIPNMIALLQSDVARMLAYSSISQAGFGLACIYINTTAALEALFLYWTLFLFTNLGAFGILTLTQNKPRYSAPFSAFGGLIKSMPIISIAAGIFMLSLAGVPPFGMFWGKLFVISAAINANHPILAAVLLLNSAIAAYYYLKLIVFMFLYESNSSISLAHSTHPMRATVGVALIICALAIFFINSFVAIIQYYIF